MHLPCLPRHVMRRERDLDTCGKTLLVNIVYILDPNRHPRALVSLFIAFLLEGSRVRAATRPPCAPWQRNIWHLPDCTAPNVGGVPQSHRFFHPHFANHSKLAARSETFSIG